MLQKSLYTVWATVLGPTLKHGAVIGWLPLQQVSLGNFFPPKYSTISYKRYCKVEAFRCYRKQATKCQTI